MINKQQVKKLSEEQKVGILFTQRCKIAGLEEEVKRLREALEKIASHKFTPEMQKLKDDGISYERILEDIATKALEDK